MARPKDFLTTTIIDIGEATVAIEDAEQIVSVGELAIAAPEGLDEPYLSHSEALETATGVDDADAIVVSLPDAQERNLHVVFDIDAVDAGTGGLEANDFIDFGIAVNGVVVLSSNEGMTDAADLSGTEFTGDGVIQVDQGDIINVVGFSESVVAEEFTFVMEAAEGQVFISRA